MRLKVIFVITIYSLLGSVGLNSVNAQTSSKVNIKAISSSLGSLQTLPDAIITVKYPDLKNPAWLEAQLAAERVKIQALRVVVYSVESRGALSADLSFFKSQVNQTLNDSRGWSRLGVNFQEVASGGSFTLVLSESSQLPTFSSICSVDWSCSAGRYVVINQDRWLGASAAWNQAGGSLRDYRHMVVNHETGHWLGHRHLNCGGVGQSAPSMQQQSISLQGCSFNAWPLASELWSTRLGVSL